MNRFGPSGRVLSVPVSRPGRPLARRMATAATSAAAVAALGGCMIWSPIQTDVPYEPSDGVSLDLGGVQIRALVIVASAKGAVGALSGAVVNSGDSGTQVAFRSGAAQAGSVSVAPGQTAPLSSVTIDQVGAAPGDVVSMVVSTPTSGDVTVQVPVLPPKLYYSTVTPSVPATP